MCVSLYMHGCLKVCVGAIRLCVCVHFNVHVVCVVPHVEVVPPIQLPGSLVFRDGVRIRAKSHIPVHSPHMAPTSSPTSSFGYLKTIFLKCTADPLK